MKAEVDAAALQETLTRYEQDMKRLKEADQNARGQRQEALHRTAYLENRLVKTEAKLKIDEQEIVRLEAARGERDNAQAGLRKAQDNEAELRQEIRKTERDLFKYREDNESLEQRIREALRKLKKLQDKELDLQNQHEKLKRVIVRKDSRIEILESYLKEDKTEQSGRAAEPAGVVSEREGSTTLPEKIDAKSRVQNLQLKKMVSKMENLESVNKLMQDNLRQVQAEKRKPIEVVKPAKPTISARAAAVILWLFWLVLLLGIGRILYDFWTYAPPPATSVTPPAPAIRPISPVEPPPTEPKAVPVNPTPIKSPPTEPPTEPRSDADGKEKPHPVKKYPMPGFSNIKAE